MVNSSDYIEWIQALYDPSSRWVDKCERIDDETPENMNPAALHNSLIIHDNFFLLLFENDYW